MTGVLRRAWLRVHRWLALSVGWLLAAVALMGALLVVVGPLDRALHPELFRARAGAAAAAAPLETARARLLREFGAGTALVFRLPAQSGGTVAVAVKGGWTGTVYVDPASGVEQGRRGDMEGARNVLFKLHSSLGLQETGKAILAWIALAYLFLLATGLVLWWPRRWPPQWRIEWRKGTLRALFDLHRTGGAVLGLLIAVSVATGAYMAWPPLRDTVTLLAGAKPVKPPKLPKLARAAGPGAEPGAGPAAATAPAPGLDALLAAARGAVPGAPVTFVTLPAQPDKPVRVRVKTADDPHPNGLTSIWLDPRTGRVLGMDRWNTLDPGARATVIVYPLHTGELGGPLLEAVAALGGLALAGLGVTGIWLWFRRRRTAALVAAARAPARPPVARTDRG